LCSVISTHQPDKQAKAKTHKQGNEMKEKYIRDHGQWVKITRHADKSFVLARGYAGATQAHDISKYSKAYLPTWKDALELATMQIETYK
jgi:hypothetical protein